ncbi:MAG: hypothetical protein LBR13_00770 [Dysgonamonadaceae bacterium]|jgi:hypothetical protein|nr:hypothetical protein [Dysgonamonadaceae bacterium]
MKKDSIEHIDKNMHIIETQVPIENQLEYFAFTDRLRQKKDKEDIHDMISLLNSENSSIHEIRYALSTLAISGKVEAFRAIEAYYADHKDFWTAMAFTQARVRLETELTDEKHFFVSTGLGGIGDRFRFFVLCKAKHLDPFSDFQKEMIEKEFKFSIENNDGILEKIAISERFFTLIMLAHPNSNLKDMIGQAVIECNQYGGFISPSFMITNVKVFSNEEIENELRKLK